jgi:hypothetical protein
VHSHKPFARRLISRYHRQQQRFHDGPWRWHASRPPCFLSRTIRRPGQERLSPKPLKLNRSKEVPMLYKTMVLEPLQQHPEIYDQLRSQRKVP